MPHGTRINGTSYGITGGKCMVNGTVYGIKKGRTLVGGTGYDISFGTPLSSYSEGDVIFINEDNSPVGFYVAKHDYESGLNGVDKTLIVRKDCFSAIQWNTSNSNEYSNSFIDNWLNSTYLNLLDTVIANNINNTKFYYTPKGGKPSSTTTLQRKILILSAAELGEKLNVPVEGNTLPIANILKIAYLNGSPTTQWTRTPQENGSLKSVAFTSSGYYMEYYSLLSNGVRPAFTLPSSFLL